MLKRIDSCLCCDDKDEWVLIFLMTTKRIFFIIVMFLLPFILPSFTLNTVIAQAEKEPADNFQLQTYLTEEEALALVFPECDKIVTDELVMAAEEKNKLEKLLNRRFYEDGFKVYIGKKKGVIQGYAIITEEIGKFHPFTFIVVVKPNGKINNVAVLVYRESRGSEIVRKRFLYQFIGKSFKNPIRINKDIINITGATMSVQCMCAGIRKVLAVINEYYLSGRRKVSDFERVDGCMVVQEINRSRNIEDNHEDPPTSVFCKGSQGEFSSENVITKVSLNFEQGEVVKIHSDKKGVTAEVKLLKQTRMIMGTFAEVSIYSNDEKTAGKAIDEALNEMERMDHIMSNYKDDSELSQLNRKAAKLPVACNRELLDVIEQSQYYSELSDGAFDVTIFPLVALWGFFDEKGHVPPNKEIERLLPAVSYKNIVINKGSDPQKPGTVFFKNAQTQIDLGAIGKGYAVDKALEVIKKFGVDNACINLGGNIYVLGTPPGKNAWKIGVQHPRNKGEILGYLELKNEATATSGDYERFFEIGGKRYSHIIDPKTGMPVSGTISVTIVAPTATEVDGLSTTVFVLGYEMSLALIKKVSGADALIAYEGKDGKIAIAMTKGFHDKFKKISVEGEDNVKWHVVASD